MVQRITLKDQLSLDLWDRGHEAWNLYVESNPQCGLPMLGGGEFHVVLRGNAAIALWRAGPIIWNAWVARNPQADIDFSNTSIEPNHRRKSSFMFRFSGLNFPAGRINFQNARFLDGDKVFDDSIFSSSSINFKGASFGNGRVSFLRVSFGHGRVSFKGASFGFGDVIFTKSNFGFGGVSFQNCDFGNGNISFRYVRFQNGSVNFTKSQFGNGNINFESSEFASGDKIFSSCIFGNGKLIFDDAIISEGLFSFQFSIFRKDIISFRNLNFEGIARFDRISGLAHCREFSFEGCNFDKLFTFSHAGEMGCPLDLRRTRLAHEIVLNDVHCGYAEDPKSELSARLSNWLVAIPEAHADTLPAWPWFRRAIDPKDSQRFRRLKQLAISEGNLYKALEFNRQELRSQRGHEIGLISELLQFFYSLCSDYGRSVRRPVIALILLTIGFGAIYANRSTQDGIGFFTKFTAGMTHSVSNIFAFVPSARDALEQSRADLFGQKDIPYEILWTSGLQGILSALLLFLLVLGLRNMFRL